MELPEWSIGRQGRAWQGEELNARFKLLPPNLEVMYGKLYWDDRTRLLMLGMLLENMGVDAAVRLGDPAVWRQALDELERERQDGSGEADI